MKTLPPALALMLILFSAPGAAEQTDFEDFCQLYAEFVHRSAEFRDDGATEKGLIKALEASTDMDPSLVTMAQTAVRAAFDYPRGTPREEANEGYADCKAKTQG